ncbi:MAG: type II secretion system F family protein [Alphaproteobacteria bacterium]|jgi:type II secretory pathway component PulF|nr:type II secretion system F family protein [Alphaproteobacteria bacterium]
MTGQDGRRASSPRPPAKEAREKPTSSARILPKPVDLRWTGTRWQRLDARFQLRQFDDEQRWQLFDLLAHHIETGDRMGPALEKIWTAVTDGGRSLSDPIAVVVGCWYRPLASATKKLHELGVGLIPPQELTLIAAGEDTEAFPAMLRRAGEIADNRQEIREAIVESLAFPAYLVLLVVSVTIFMTTFFIPEIVTQTGASTVTRFTGIARLAIQFSEAIRICLIPAGVAAIAAAIWLRWALPNWDSPLRVRTAEKYWPFNVYKMIEATSFVYALALLVDKTRNEQEALAHIARRSSPYVRRRIERMQQQRGKALGSAMHAAGDQFPDPLLIKSISSYQQASRLGEELARILPRWKQQQIKRLKKAAKSLGRTLSMVTLALIVLQFVGLNSIIEQASSLAR